MANDRLEETYIAQLNDILATIDDVESAWKKADEKAAEKRIEIAKRIANKEIEFKTEASKRFLMYEEKAKEKAAIKAVKDAEKKRGKKLTPEEKKAIVEKTKEEFKIADEEKQKLKEKYEKEERKKDLKNTQETAKRNYEATQRAFEDSLKRGSIQDRISAAKNIFGKQYDENGNEIGGGVAGQIGRGLSAIVSTLGDLAQQLNKDIEDIASSKTAIDTRLQGSRGKRWDAISSDINRAIGASPYIKQADVVSNLKTMVGQGIAFNVEQRAFLQTLKTTIADTFDANDATLKKLVRIQQEDSTAARLGMESALTSFLNNMYETTEYMTDAAREIKSQLYEAQALMGTAEAAGFEYQVQKWMGSLYSVGFNQSSGLAGALGKLAAGDISGINSGGYGNLLIMAANRANLSVADMLSKGLDESDTNQLMQAMVEYLGQIYNETKGSNILAQQYAGVFGLTASDLKAAANLAGSTGNIANNNLSYNGMLQQLVNMTNSMGERISLGGKLSNAWANMQYSTAAGIANNPALYAIYKIGNLLNDTMGGIPLPIYTPMGGIAANLNIADLMQAGAIGGSLLGNIGSMLGGLFGGSGRLLEQFNVMGKNVVSRGTGEGLLTTQLTKQNVSESGYAGNAAGGDVYNKTMTDSSDDISQQITASNENSESATINDVNDSILLVYKLLQNAVDGDRPIKVTTVSTYGLPIDYNPSGL